MKTPLGVTVAERLALTYAAHRAWKLGTVHEVRVSTTYEKRTGSIDLSWSITRRRDVRVPV